MGEEAVARVADEADVRAVLASITEEGDIHEEGAVRRGRAGRGGRGSGGRGGEEGKANGVEARGRGRTGERVFCPRCGKDFTRRDLPIHQRKCQGRPEEEEVD